MRNLSSWEIPTTRFHSSALVFDAYGFMPCLLHFWDAMAWTSTNTLPENMEWKAPTKNELQHLFCAFNGVEPKTWSLNQNAPNANTAESVL